MSSLDCSVQLRGLSVILGLQQQFTACKGMMPFYYLPSQSLDSRSWLLFATDFSLLTSFLPCYLADSHKLPLGAYVWSFHPLSSDLAMVLFSHRQVGGVGLSEGVVTPLDSSLESRSQVWRRMLAADVCGTTSPPVFTAGLSGLIRVDIFFNVMGTVQLQRNPGFG